MKQYTLRLDSTRQRPVVLLKDGKIGCVGLITDAGHATLSSGIESLSVKNQLKNM